MGTFAMIDILITIVLVTAFGGLLALFSHLIDYCLWPGSIFGRWQPLLASWLISNADMREVLMLLPKDREDEMINRVQSNFVFKILGGCIICTNIWIGMISWIFINIIGDFGWWYGIVYVLTGSFILRKIVN